MTVVNPTISGNATLEPAPTHPNGSAVAPATVAPAENSAATTETLWRVHAAQNEWIRFTDTKAGALLAANGVLVSVALGGMKDNRSFLLTHLVVLIPVMLALLAVLVSSVYCLFCIRPSVVPANPAPAASLIFFGHIAREERFPTAQAFEEAAKTMFSNEAAALSQISEQVWVNAKIAFNKYKQVAWAVKFLEIALFFGLVGGVGAFFG